MRLIDADALMDEIDEIRDYYVTWKHVANDIKNLVESAPTVRGDNPSPWIPVTEKFPKVDIPVIGFDAFSESVLECCYSGNNWYLMDEHETELSNVTHWMELPKHPTE